MPKSSRLGLAGLALALAVAFAALLLALLFSRSSPGPAAPGRNVHVIIPATAGDDTVLTNDLLEVRVGMSAERSGAITVIDRAAGRIVAENLGTSVLFRDGMRYALPGDVRARGNALVQSGIATPLGQAQELRVPFASRDGLLAIDLVITLPRASDSFLLQVAVRGLTAARTAADILYFRVPDGESGHVFAGEATLVLSDATEVLSEEMLDDGEMEWLIGIGSPVYVRGQVDAPALVIALIDEPARWPLFSLVRDGAALRLTLESGPLGRLADQRAEVDRAGTAFSPRLLVDLAHPDTRFAFADYKRLIATMYPEPPLPAWFGPQWDSYWVYDLEINEENTVANADAIVTNFADLGPWSIIFDAGWYVDSGLPESAPDVINYEKFPNGIRPVVDYLKERGLFAIMYFSAPYVDRRIAVDPAGFAGPPPWMSLAGFVDRYPTTVISLSESADGPSFIYDFLNLEFIEYLRGLMRLYLVDFAADGILLDLVGEAAPAIFHEEPDDRAPRLRVPMVARQSQEVYRRVWEAARLAKADALVEGSWLNPVLARSWSQTWRYGDEVARFSFTYPSNGLVQKVDYVILQRQMLGVRPHVGYLRGPGTATQIQQWWMGAALALDAQFAIAVDFTETTPRAAETYREYLAAYRPFLGETRFGPGGLAPEWFATTRDGTTYLGVINRATEPLFIDIPFGEIGLPGRPALVYEPEADTAVLAGGTLSAYLPPESFRLFVLRDTPGVLWSSRRVEVRAEGSGQRILVQASPLATGGRLLVYAPEAVLEVGLVDGFRDEPEVTGLRRLSFDSPEPVEVRLTPASHAVGP